MQGRAELGHEERWSDPDASTHPPAAPGGGGGGLSIVAEYLKTAAPGAGEAPSIIEFYEVPTIIRGVKAYVAIAEHGGELYYVPVEPTLTEAEKKILERIRELLVYEYVPKSARETRNPLKVLVKAFEYALRRLELIGRLRPYVVRKIFYHLYRDYLGYGPLEIPMRDPYIEDISVPGVNEHVYVWHSRYENLRTPITFHSEAELERIEQLIAVKSRIQLTTAQPIVDVVTPEGYRAHIVLGIVAAKGGTITIRRFRAVPFTILELVKSKTLNLDIAAYFWYLVEHKRSIVIFGSTGAGKTTLLNAVAMLIRPSMKIITIEETREINLLHPHWVPLVAREIPGVTRVTLYDLLKSSLRQRPDYVIVGEIRGEEAYVFFQAMATGHGGMTTIHGESLTSITNRLISPPMNIPVEQIGVVDAFVHIARVRIGDRVVRRVIEVAEVADIDRERRSVEYNKVFRWTGEITDTFQQGKSLVMNRIAEYRGVDITVVEHEVLERRRFLEDLYRRGVFSYREFAKEVMAFYLERGAA